MLKARFGGSGFGQQPCRARDSNCEQHTRAAGIVSFCQRAPAAVLATRSCLGLDDVVLWLADFILDQLVCKLELKGRKMSLTHSQGLGRSRNLSLDNVCVYIRDGEAFIWNTCKIPIYDFSILRVFQPPY